MVQNRKIQDMKKSFWQNMIRYRVMIFMSLPAIVLVFIFNYIPMYGVIIAFKDYSISKGTWGSPWVGLEHFRDFFDNPFAVRTIKNSFVLGILAFVISFPAPIILALLINEVHHEKFKRITQTISYLPHFISTVIIIGILKRLSSIHGGLFNEIVQWFGMEPIIFFEEPGWFRPLYIGSGIWQGIGWGTIIYLAAIAGCSPTLYEAAIIDGANRLQRVLHITIPTILPTVSILLILSIGGVMGSDFEKIILMYSPSTYSTADVIATYTYRSGIVEARYSFSAAVGLFNTAVGFVLVYSANRISRKISGNSLW